MSGAYPPHAGKKKATLTANEIQTELSNAVKSATHTRAPYKKQAVVLIHFEVDDLHCDGPEKELADTFRQFYGIHNITHLLLMNNDPIPHVLVNETLNKLIRQGNAAKDCLIILYYSGHGQIVVEQSVSKHQGLRFQLKLAGAYDKDTGKPLTPLLDWEVATSMLHGSPCHVLHIMDCCFAAEYMDLDVELLAAATEAAGSDVGRSFTKALVHELRSLSSQPFTISTLYQRLMTNRSALNLDCIPLYNNCNGRDSITLGNAVHRPQAAGPLLKPDSPRILLAANVSHDVNMADIQSLKDWLTSLLPTSIMGMEIKLEGAWDSSSSSSLLLFSLPITVWAHIDRTTSAYTYVGEVTSNNKLLQQAPTQNPALAFRSPQGLETRKPGESSAQN